MLTRARQEEEEEEPEDDGVLLARAAQFATVVQCCGADVCGVDDERRHDGADAIAGGLCPACARAVEAERAGRSALFGDGEDDDGLAAAAADACGWCAIKELVA